MKACTLLHPLFLLVSLTTAGSVQAACQPDAPEIGDIGPDSLRVCTTLEHDFPNSDVQITNRDFPSSNDVIVTAQVDGQPLSIEYQLVMADWVESPGSCLAKR